MRHGRPVVPASLAILLGAALSACHSKPTPAASPVATQSSNAEGARLARARADSIARAEAARRARDDSIAAAARNAAAARDAQTAMRASLTAVVLFDYDEANLTNDGRSVLDAKIRILAANPTVGLRIAGHTDERGSDEYNLALGQRRAASAKRYIVEHGISADRLETSSYGEERPVAAGHDESAWCQNRRAEFEITGSVSVLKRP